MGVLGCAKSSVCVCVLALHFAWHLLLVATTKLARYKNMASWASHFSYVRPKRNFVLTSRCQLSLHLQLWQQIPSHICIYIHILSTLSIYIMYMNIYPSNSLSFNNMH